MSKKGLFRLVAGAAIALSLGGCYYPYGYGWGGGWRGGGYHQGYYGGGGYGPR
ncbi:hypothetical protein [Acidisoma cladoniae]|jgi:hypothetical protein|uniref:hypothetical protein n=1 Tax=Acidisoma cladoniae TaxID=3040935 RepID=UPI00254CF674|nr:hypothetical protein [Acidisoma sp. PAMC 29798]